MTKQEMINHLKATYESWGAVYEAFKRWKSINGWYVVYGGESIYEMYLTNDSGETIMHSDFK